MRVLVVGGFGDVGRSVLAELARAGHTVRCLDIRTAATLVAAARLRGKKEPGDENEAVPKRGGRKGGPKS